MNVREWLTRRGILFETIHHRRSFALASDSGAVAVAEELVGKTVLLRVDDSMVLAVLPTTHLMDLGRVKQILRAEHVSLAAERQFNNWLPDCEIGAAPPFGRQYGITTLVDSELAASDEIIFEGTTPEQAIRMAFADYESLESPIVGTFAYQ